jgi:hypothetical protein
MAHQSVEKSAQPIPEVEAFEEYDSWETKGSIISLLRNN